MASAISFKQSQYIYPSTAPHPQMHTTAFDLIIHNKKERAHQFWNGHFIFANAQDNYRRLLKLPRGSEALNVVCSGEKTAPCESSAWWLRVLSVTPGGLMMCFCRCVPLQEMVLSTPGALRASSAPPVAMALVKSCPPSLRRPLEGTWEWEAASQTYGFSSLRRAKGWCPRWWVGSTQQLKVGTLQGGT